MMFESDSAEPKIDIPQKMKDSDLNFESKDSTIDKNYSDSVTKEEVF